MEKVIELLTLWKEYQDNGKAPDFQSFGKWLNEKDLREKKERSTNDFSENEDAMIGFYLGNLIAYSDTWTKLSLRELPVLGFSDYGMLNFILKSKNPTKKEVVKYHIGENSTSFEALKRFKKNDLIEEEIDPDDKRLRRVRLTKKGTEVCKKSLEKAIKLSSLLVGNLSAKEKQEFHKILEKLFKFHHSLYEHSSKEDIIKEYEI